MGTTNSMMRACARRARRAGKNIYGRKALGQEEWPRHQNYRVQEAGSQRLESSVGRVSAMRKSVGRLLADNLGQVEEALQVGLQVGREKTQKLSQLQNTVQQVNRLLTWLTVLHSWEHPRCTLNYLVLLASAGSFLLLVPPRWLFLGVVVAKFAPGEGLSRRLKHLAVLLAAKYLQPPEPDDEAAEATLQH